MRMRVFGMTASDSKASVSQPRKVECTNSIRRIPHEPKNKQNNNNRPKIDKNKAGNK